MVLREQTNVPVVDFPLHSGAYAHDPYPVLDELRAQSPLAWHKGLESFLVLGYEEARTVLSDEERFISVPPGEPNPFPGNLIRMRGSEHRRYRKLVTPAFAAGALRNGIGPLLPEIAHGLIDGFADAGTTELTAAFSDPLPATVIRTILEIEDFDDREFMADADLLLEHLADPGNRELAAAGAAAGDRIRGFIARTVERDRTTPGGGLLTQLRTFEDNGFRLSSEEIIHFCAVLVLAGIETTQRLIANLVFALCRHPEQLPAARADPALLDSAIEESLRWLPPNQLRMRWADRDTELRGVPIARGAKLYALIASANRDPDAYDDPARFDAGRFRDPKAVAPHLAFGWGPHYCIGAYLSRLEARAAVGALLERVDGLRLDPSHEIRFSGFRNRSPESLHVLFESR